MPNLTIGTAGHVDHGKSALVEALTGLHPDRLVEEQQRGMTIDLGFAFMPLSDGQEVPIIDVPGHERFLKTMVAGVSGIDLVLFVIAADEGVMPQTIEHLGTVQLMGVEQGLIVLTKRDLVEEEWLLLVEEEVRELVKHTFLQDAEIHRVSSITGEGMDGLRQNIEDILGQVQPKQDHGTFRLPIDRVFTLKGFGTIVAGTVVSGGVKVEDDLELLPPQIPVRLRGLQTHNQKVEQATAGQRVALNLANIKVEDIERGYELSVPGYLKPTMMLDAQIHALGTLHEPLKNRTRIRLHKGTAEIIGRIVLLDKEELEPGDTCYVQFRLERPIVAERYERFIIRGFSSMRLLGGGRFLDVYPLKHRRFRETVIAHLREITTPDPAVLIRQILQDAYGEQRVRTIEDLVRATNLNLETVTPIVNTFVEDGILVSLPGLAFMHQVWYDRIQAEMLDKLEGLHKEQRLKASVSRESVRNRLSAPLADSVFDIILKDLITRNLIVQLGSEIRLPSHTISLTPQEEHIQALIHEMCTGHGVKILSINDLLKCAPDEKPDQVKAVVTYLFDQDVLVEFSDRLVIHQDTLERSKQALIEYLKTNETVRAAEFRDYQQVSRAHATALLDYFCDRGVTNREAGTHRLASEED